MTRRCLLPALVLVTIPAGTPHAAARDATVVVFDAAAVQYDADQAEPLRRGDHLVRDGGRTLVRTVTLPAAPANQRDTRGIRATVAVEPVPADDDGRPGDEWTRIGSLTVATTDREGRPAEVELMRFTTGFGAGGVYTQDVTALAPLLAGPRELRLTLSTYRNPAWRVTVRLAFSRAGAGYRRPVLAEPLFYETALTAEAPRAAATVEIPPGHARPRVRLLSTGHATDGGPEHEFITCTHVLRVDGREVARWRPWSEAGARVRGLNPWAGRRTIDGREVRASDLDRSGWQPGLAVQPLLVPVPELTPGVHRVTLEVLGIRPAGRDPGHGYWRVSGVVLADEPWPADAGAP